MSAEIFRNPVLAALIALGTLLNAHAAGAPANPVARVLGEDVGCVELGSSEPRACALALLRHVRGRVERDYIARRGLSATPAEVAALEAYNAAFERHDREQRARKLTELDARLMRDDMAPAERERLQAFRDTLARLARFDADVDAGIEERDAVPPRTLRDWVESAKLDDALYGRYGGSVGVAASGPYAHGARAALIEDYLAQGDVILYDRDMVRHFRAALHTGPKISHPAGEPDFTPFWQRPIPASYMGP